MDELTRCLGPDGPSSGRSVATARIGALALVIVVLVAVSGSDRASAAGYWGAGYKICHPFKVQYGPMYVSAKNVRCRKAVRILKEWWLGPDDRQTHVRKGGYDYYRLDRYPGWLCGDGASAGGCHKGNHHAVYNFFEPRLASTVTPRAVLVTGCPTFRWHGLTFTSIERQSHVRCGLVRRLMRGTYSNCGYRETWPWHTADGTPYGRPTCWFRRGWRCTTGAGGAVCWSATRAKLNAITGSGRPMAISVEVR